MLWTVVALGLNAYIHFTLAPSVETFPGSALPSSGINLGTLYYVEAGVNALAAVLVLIRPRVWSSLFAVLVALTGLATLVVSVWMPIHLPLGLPGVPMGSWTTEKAISAGAQAFVVVSGMIVAATTRRR
ncbi:hypothetical protein D4765_08120 [Subtercola vilae]|uniref:Uncharacterized protein n=1 Tax=Subtercola vilae TaxID=2056433 RepID=A0A4T2BZQ7_9MICO|nr:hypothetical protein D4765_08120 [Subtercola vilae]